MDEELRSLLHLSLGSDNLHTSEAGELFVKLLQSHFEHHGVLRPGQPSSSMIKVRIKIEAYPQVS